MSSITQYKIIKMSEKSAQAPPPVIIKCNEMLMPVPLHLLCKESTYFCNKYAHIANDQPSGEETTKDKDDTSVNEAVLQTEIVEIEDFSSKSVQVLLNYLRDCTDNVFKHCTIEILEEVINFCNKYGIQKPIPHLVESFKSFKITLSNVAAVYKVAENLKNNKDFEEYCDTMSDRCIMFARFNLASQQDVIFFLKENQGRKDDALKLLEILKYDRTATIRWKWKPRHFQNPDNRSASFIIGNEECYLEFNQEDFGRLYEDVDEFKLKLVKEKENSSSSFDIEWKVILVDWNNDSEHKNNVIFLDNERCGTYTLSKRKLECCHEVWVEAFVTVYNNSSYGQQHDSCDAERTRPPPCTTLVWSSKESYHLGDLNKSANDDPVTEQAESKTMVLLDCKGDYVCADKSVLCRESTYFQSRNEEIFYEHIRIKGKGGS